MGSRFKTIGVTAMVAAAIAAYLTRRNAPILSRGISKSGKQHEDCRAESNSHDGEIGSANLTPAIIETSGLLLPNERIICVTRKHWAAVTGSTTITIATLAAAGILSEYLNETSRKNSIFSIALFGHVVKVASQDKQNLLLYVWVSYLLVLFYLLFKLHAWLESYCVITDRQLILAVGAQTPRFASLRISKLTCWYLRESLGGGVLGYKSLVLRIGEQGSVVRTIGYVPVGSVKSIAEALSSIPREAGDEEAFGSWATGGLRRRVRLTIAALLIFFLIVLAVSAAASPHFREQLSNETEVIALIPILIVLIAPKS